MNRSICVLYGINEGPAMGRKLVGSCEQSGFTIVHSPEAADVIFAHSGGCLLVPPKNNAQLIVLVGLAYWPGRPWIFATGKKVWREWKLYRQNRMLRQWGLKWVYHVRYSFDLKRAMHMAQNLGFDRPWNSAQYQAVVRNRNDVYCSPAVLRIPFKGPRTFVSLPGEHDDCWDNPEPYINLMQSLFK